LKKFLKLPKNFSIEILNQIFPLDLEEWIIIESLEELEKNGKQGLGDVRRINEGWRS